MIHDISFVLDCVLLGAPHVGQAFAPFDISLPHSWQLISPIITLLCTLHNLPTIIYSKQKIVNNKNRAYLAIGYTQVNWCSYFSA